MCKKGKDCSSAQIKLLTSFHLTNEALIRSSLFFYLNPGLVCKKIHRFVQYILKKCFNTLVQSAVKTQREADENPKSSVAGETMKLLAHVGIR